MNKLKMQSRDVVGGNAEKIAALFPQCVTERLNKEGKPELAIDFDKLRAELSNEVLEDGEERYQFTWPDKRAASRLANEPTNMTLRPCRKESVGKDGTPGGFDSENIYIEGDNLDVLKVLRETYLGRVKMIYIDPPYNTGNDFVYNDDFAQSREEFEQSSGLFDEDGNQIIDPMQRNTESNGRFHTDWLNMIYPRLKVARDLLSEDGILAVSIGDKEVKNMISILDEIFGFQNQVCIFTWKSRAKPTNAGNAKFRPQKVAEYVLIYSRRNPDTLIHNVVSSKERTYPHSDEDGAYRTTTILTSNRGTFRRDTMRFPSHGYTPDEDFRWKAGKSTIDNLFDTNRMLFNEDGIPMEKKYQHEEVDPLYPIYTFIDSDLSGTAEKGKAELSELIGNKHGFDTVKPVELMKYLIQTFTSPGDTIIDIFAGSCTTIQAVWELNLESSDDLRKCILIQYPESIPAKSEAYMNGFKTIVDIGIRRIKALGNIIGFGDIGIRFLKLDSSNMEDVFYTPDKFEPSLLDGLVDNIKSDRTAEDLLFQVMLDLGIELSAKIEQKEIAGKKVFSVDDDYLLACFDTDVNETTIEEMAKLLPTHLVIRDASAANDNVLDNFDQIIESYSNEKKISTHIL